MSLSLIVGAVAILMGLIFWVLLPKGECKSLLGKSTSSGSPVLLLAFSALAINIGLTRVLSYFIPTGNRSQSTDLLNLMKDPLGKIIVLALTLVITPLAEEILFRGFLQDGFQKNLKLNVNLAIGLSAILFGIAHGVNHFPGSFWFAVCLGLLRVKTKSIRINTIVHAINNAFGMSILYFHLPDLPLLVAIGLLVLGAIAFTPTVNASSPTTIRP